MIKNYSDIIEKNGKTIRENNMEISHKIPIGTLVEISSTSPSLEQWSGVRLYIIGHHRDCDGTPLYSLGPKDEKIFGHGGFNERCLKPIHVNWDENSELMGN